MRIFWILLLSVLPCFSLVSQAQKTELMVQSGHTSEVLPVGFSSDGHLVLTGAGHTVRLWDSDSGDLIRILDNEVNVTSAKFFPGNRQVLIGGEDGIARLRDVLTGQLVKEFSKHDKAIMAVDVAPDGLQIVTAGMDGKARIWDVGSATMVAMIQSTHPIMAANFSPNGRYVLCGSGDAVVRLWELKTNRLVRELMGQTAAISSVAFSPDGKKVIAGEFGNDSNEARIWNLATGDVEAILEHSSFPYSVAFSPDCRQVLTGCMDFSARLWDAKSGRLLRSFQGNLLRGGLAFSPNGQQVLTAGYDNVARLWATDTGVSLHTFDGNAVATPYVEFSPKVEQALSIGITPDKAKKILIGQLRFIVPAPFGALVVASAAISRDHQNILMGSSENSAVQLLDNETGKVVRTFLGHDDKVQVVAFSPNEREVLSGSEDKTARLWDKATGNVLRIFRGHQSVVRAVDFSPDGSQVLTGSQDGTVRLWNKATGRVLHQLTVDKAASPLTLAMFSQNGQNVLTGSADFLGHIWNTASGQLLCTLVGHTGPITTAAFSPDGRQVLTASTDATTRLWDIETGRELAKLMSFKDGSWAVVDSQGRYDGSNQGNLSGLHWVRGLEVIELNQLRDGYYTPDLLARTMRGEKLPPVQAVQEFLPPLVEFKAPTPGQTRFEVRLTNRGKGIGPVEVLLNGQQVLPDARPVDFNSNQLKATLQIVLPPELLATGRQNSVEVRAFPTDLGGYKGVQVEFKAAGQENTQPPQLFLVAAGVSDYNASQLQLRFAAKDARDMARDLYLGASNLLGAENVHVTLLSSNTRPVDDLPVTPQKATREAFEKAFAEIRTKAGDNDVIVVYLSGHGISYKAEQGVSRYAYLTQDANTGDLVGSPFLKQWSISDADLLDWVKCKAQKKVIILDTCAAGTVAETLAMGGKADDDQKKAIARLNARTGFHVLMGCAGNRLSYEATQYGQGLLTYALIEGLKGGKLRDETFLDVAPWFNYARERVPQLATQIGLNLQEPIISAPRNETFDVGRYGDSQKQKITLQQPVPLLLPPTFLNVAEAADTLRLAVAVRSELRRRQLQSARGEHPKAWLLESEGLNGAVRPSGTYEVNGETVTVRLVLRREVGDKSEKVGQGEIKAPASDMAGLSRTIADTIEELIVKP